MNELETKIWELTKHLDPIAKLKLFATLATKANNERCAVVSKPVELELV